MSTNKKRTNVRFVARVRLRNGRVVTAKELGVRGIPIYSATDRRKSP